MFTQMGDPATPAGVNAVAVGRLGDHDVIVTGGNDGTVRIWDTNPSANSSPATTGRVTAVAVGRWA